MTGPDETTPGSIGIGSWDRLDRALGRASDAPTRPGNQLTLLENGPETFDEWLEEIGRAEKWIYLEFFQFEDGRIGRRFAEARTEKAREGVRVRLLYDWMGSLTVARSFWRELRSAGIEVRVVNPPAVSSPLRCCEARSRNLTHPRSLGENYGRTRRAGTPCGIPRTTGNHSATEGPRGTPEG
jgi:phosphatidylserine/phosphatidylglycerophosphate/cardiolipin synthase-like enzyme